MDLTNDDVADILALLDSLPYDALDVETPRFRLTLRRAPGGGWTEESQVLAEPTLAAPSEDGTAGAAPGPPEVSGISGSGSAAVPAAGPASRMAGPGMAGPGGDGAAGEAAVDGGPAQSAGGAAGLTAVPAPLPGTFYRAPRPGADPFVQVGDLVSPDTVVAIIETMKLMNSVHAGTAGRVSRICLENGDFTSAGATLLLIEAVT
jgi:acetyl-CoA carboxylase biotin carboxyl carrier protein